MAAQFGRRLRRGATTTAVAAAAVAALSASQAPGVTAAVPGDSQGRGGGQSTSEATPPAGTPVTGNSPYYTDLPPLTIPGKPATSTELPVTTGPAEAGIPATVLAAYKQAEQTIATSDPGCKVPWQLLAAIGKVESGQARGGRVDANGTTLSPIRGPVLNGVGFANISDTDNGAHDGDTVYDRAVGPMQFIPSTWATWGQDANSDGLKDPNNIYDAALAAGRYLCAGNRDLTVQSDLGRAILGYNQSREYLRTVLSWFEYYKSGSHEVPDGEGVLPEAGTPDSPATGSGSIPGGAAPGGTTPATSPPSTQKPDPKPPKGPGGGTDTPPTTPGSKPPQPPNPPTKPNPKPPTPPAQSPVTRVEDAGTGKLTAAAGRDFGEKVTVRVKNAAGQAVEGKEVRFEIVGDTDARFHGGRTSVVRVSGANGIAVSPLLKAGEKTGAFTVWASVVGRELKPVAFSATVTAPVADKLTRVGDSLLTAAPGAEFADRVAVKTAYQGADASGVAITATMIKSAEGTEPVENGQGPYFKDAAGKPVRALTALTTDSNGVLTLPKIFADDQSGTFLLRLTAAGGVSITIELQVAPASSPSASPTPSQSQSPSPTESPTG
ncbi:lytic transglycosylase domain-containing protein [Streptomyces albipurpureus]|uniref:Lytic transglycosylase domain-containing protein n=1 Tax=Streptomyces albipurpureus TaxID=2897419 RepID=A0ABT0UQL1_9ACTN|nr:lytic transglycosylase domain-containing protein [Streptomyces sp. CWNU-1]MCM2390813.1 lytic transglycosylase domain-containing protein [Streptomyces sp. CWNU-1]